MLDDRFDDLLRESASDYNDPPETPREEMWAAIQAKRTEQADDSVLPLRRLRHLRPLRWAAGIAAVLALGIGLGRLTVRRPEPAPAPLTVATATPKANGNAAYQIATTEHLEPVRGLSHPFPGVAAERRQRTAGFGHRRAIAGD